MTNLKGLINELLNSEFHGFTKLPRPQKLLYEIKIGSLKERELDLLKEQVKNHPAVSVFIESILTEQTKKQDFLKIREEQRLYRNETVKDLLKLYIDKKSGKVVDSRKKPCQNSRSTYNSHRTSYRQT